MKKYLITFSLIILLCLTCCSCVHTKYIHRKQYALKVKSAKETQAKKSDKILEITNVSMVPQFAGFSFIYKIGDINYTRDYYHAFFSSPAQQIGQIIVNYLRAENLFKYISNEAGILEANYFLRANILELYADYRNYKQPRAVIAIRFTLFAPGDKTRILINRTFREAVPLKRKDTQSLVYAWNKGLKMILISLSRDLRRIVTARPY